MPTTYIALVHKDEDSDFGVSFPDLPGCVTAAATFAEAQQLASEVLDFHLDGLLEEGLPVPSPRPPDQIATTDEAAGATLLAVAARKPPRRRINVTFPPGLLREVDRVAGEHGMARSEFLVRSAREFLKRAADAGS